MGRRLGGHVMRGVAFAVLVAGALRARADVGGGWNLLFVVYGESNLEAEYVDRVTAMARAGESQGAEVFCLFDRSATDAEPGYSGAAVGDVPAWHGGRTLRLVGTKWQDLDAGKPDANIDLRDPEVIEAFVRRANELHPAPQTMLVLKGHGSRFGGPTDNTGPLTVSKLAAALPARPDGCPPVDVLVLDICNGASYEGGSALQASTRYLVTGVSELFVDSIRYEDFLRDFDDDPCSPRSARSVCLGLLDAYEPYDRRGPRRSAYPGALVALDLSTWPALDQALDRVAGPMALAMSQPHGVALGELATTALMSTPLFTLLGACEPSYAPDPDPCPVKLHFARTWCNSFDVGHLARVWAQGGDRESLRAARALERAVGRSVVDIVRGPDMDDVAGIPLFLPCDPNGWASACVGSPTHELCEQLGASGMSTAWRRVVDAYVGRECPASREVSMAPTVVSDDVVSDRRPITLRSCVTSDLAGAGPSFFVLAIGNAVVGLVPVERAPDGSLEHTWDGRWFLLQTESDRKAIPALVSWVRRVEGCPDRYTAWADVAVNDECKSVVLDLQRTASGWAGTVLPGSLAASVVSTARRWRAGDRVRPAPRRSLFSARLERKDARAPELPEILGGRLELARADDLRLGYQPLGAVYGAAALRWTVTFMTLTLGGRSVVADPVTVEVR